MCGTTSLYFQWREEGLFPIAIDIAGILANQKNCRFTATPLEHGLSVSLQTAGVGKTEVRCAAVPDDDVVHNFNA
jgi:hypothetical protein